MYSKETIGEIMKTIKDLSKTLVSYCDDRAQLSEIEALLLLDDMCTAEVVEKANAVKKIAECNIDLAEKIIELHCESLFILSRKK